jgi:hypothetical protein
MRSTEQWETQPEEGDPGDGSEDNVLNFSNAQKPTLAESAMQPEDVVQPQCM